MTEKQEQQEEPKTERESRNHTINYSNESLKILVISFITKTKVKNCLEILKHISV